MLWCDSSGYQECGIPRVSAQDASQAAYRCCVPGKSALVCRAYSTLGAAAMNAALVGRSIRRKEDFRFITGRGHYTDDFVRPGQAYAAFVRSPHAHARIRRIDTTEALATP